MNGYYVHHDDVFRFVTQKMNKYRRIAIKHCLCTQSAFKQLSAAVLSIQFRGSTVGRWPPELAPRRLHADECGFHDVAKELQRDHNRWTCFKQHANALFHLPVASREITGNTIGITPHTRVCSLVWECASPSPSPSPSQGQPSHGSVAEWSKALD